MRPLVALVSTARDFGCPCSEASEPESPSSTTKILLTRTVPGCLSGTYQALAESGYTMRGHRRLAGLRRITLFNGYRVFDYLSEPPVLSGRFVWGSGSLPSLSDAQRKRKRPMRPGWIKVV